MTAAAPRQIVGAPSGRKDSDMSQPTANTPTDTLEPTPRPDLPVILAGLVLSLILASLDQSIVNTALPRMASDLGGLAHLSWVITAFMLSSTIATPIFGKLSDMFGRRNFLLLAIALFVGASALCGLAQTMGQLIAFRFVQGIGAGGIMTLTQTIISDVVGPRERVRYQGLFSGTFALSAVAGPIIGGGLTTALSWRWVFYVNLPIGIVALAFILRALKPTEQRTTHQVDYLGAVLLAVASSLALLLFSWVVRYFPGGPSAPSR